MKKGMREWERSW